MDNILALALGAVASHIQGKMDIHPIGKFVLSLIICVIAGALSTLITLFSTGEFTQENLLANIGAAFIAGQTYYQVYFKRK